MKMIFSKIFLICTSKNINLAENWTILAGSLKKFNPVRLVGFVFSNYVVKIITMIWWLLRERQLLVVFLQLRVTIHSGRPVTRTVKVTAAWSCRYL